MLRVGSTQFLHVQRSGAPRHRQKNEKLEEERLAQQREEEKEARS